jgi:NADH-quinone oxidoreductase subunit J
MNADTVIFFACAVIAVFGATMMISQRNPVAAVMYLIVSLVAQAVCYVQLGGLFMGAVLIVVYAGAILVLFLFVIMLLNLRTTDTGDGQREPISSFTKYVVALLLVVELVLAIKGGMIQATTTGILSMVPDDFGSVASVAKLLFTRYLYPFELTGVLLLVAIVGAVVLVKRDRSESPAVIPDRNQGADKPSEGVAG